MSENHAKSEFHLSSVRYSRVLSLPWAISLGASVTAGLGVFFLFGLLLNLSRGSTHLAYGLALLVYAPLALTYAERAAALREGAGAFALAGPNEPPWLVYTSGWFSLGGLVCLMGLLAWGGSLYVNLLLERLFTVSVSIRWLSLLGIGLVALNSALGGQGRWRTRARLAYLTILVFGGVLLVGWTSTGAEVRARFALRGPDNMILVTALLGATLWGIGLIAEHRDQVRLPSRTLLPAMLGALAVGLLGGVAAALMVYGHAIQPEDLMPLATIAGGWRSVFEVIYLIAGVMLALLALDRTLVSSLRQMVRMAEDGFLPERWLTAPSIMRTPILALLLVVTLSGLVVALAPPLIITGLAALIFLVTTVLINAHDLFRSQPGLPARRRLKLPFHPLFPGIAVGLSLYLSLAIDLQVWWITSGWAAAGGIYYLIYARQSSLDVRRREHVVSERARAVKEEVYHVLVVANVDEAVPSLIQIGKTLAKTQDGQVLVLQVMVQPEQSPVDLKRTSAQQAWQNLKEHVQSAGTDGVKVETMVRLAPSATAGILETVREEGIDLVLMSWEAESEVGEVELEPVVDRVVRAAPCDVAVLRGRLNCPLQEVIVSTAGGPHASAALDYGKRLVQAEHGRVVALNILRGPGTPKQVKEAESRLRASVQEAGDGPEFDLRVVPAVNIERGIVRASEGIDLLLMGSSTEGLLDQAVFAGIPTEVAKTRAAPTLLVKHFEGTSQFWLRRFWELLYEPMPNLNVSERAEVYRQMRNYALAGIDFYTLIVLSSIIAYLGLVQNSAAVIIGAMLVAPLMSPILAMAHGIVQGNVRMITRAIESTIKGVLLAIGVSVAVTLVLPPNPPSAEILARVHPNLLDLMIALASGAAGAYASSRKEVSTALPGVAIAAALVPPLSVAGYGLGSSQYTVAGGALLLFTTNLSAIILAAATIFLLLGFRPTRAEEGMHMRRGITLSILALIVIAMPLAFTSVGFRQQIAREVDLETVLNQSLETDVSQVENIDIEAQGGGFVVSATVYVQEGFDAGLIAEVQDSLSQAVGVPVTFNARLVTARFEQVPVAPTPTPTPGR